MTLRHAVAASAVAAFAGCGRIDAALAIPRRRATAQGR
jgi:hypothetical protein